MDTHLSLEQLLLPFTPVLRPNSDMVGIEVECAVLNLDTGRSAPYYGSRGTRELLQNIAGELGGKPMEGPEGINGIQLDDHSRITLEAGGALESPSARTSS